MAGIGTSTLVIETNTVRLIHFCHFCGKKSKGVNQKIQSVKNIIQAPERTQTKTFSPHDHLCTLIITGR
jgi:hypothetical protein